MINLKETDADSAQVTQPKFKNLIERAMGVNGVIDHLRELHQILGVSYDNNPKEATPKSPSEPSLVRMLNELPNELSCAHQEIHNMISAIADQLN